jgi:hypothetical protein
VLLVLPWRLDQCSSYLKIWQPVLAQAPRAARGASSLARLPSRLKRTVPGQETRLSRPPLPLGRSSFLGLGLWLRGKMRHSSLPGASNAQTACARKGNTNSGLSIVGVQMEGAQQRCSFLPLPEMLYWCHSSSNKVAEGPGAPLGFPCLAVSLGIQKPLQSCVASKFPELGRYPLTPPGDLWNQCDGHRTLQSIRTLARRGRGSAKTVIASEWVDPSTCRGTE